MELYDGLLISASTGTFHRGAGYSWEAFDRDYAVLRFAAEMVDQLQRVRHYVSPLWTSVAFYRHLYLPLPLHVTHLLHPQIPH